MSNCDTTVVSHTARLVNLEGTQETHTKAIKEFSQMLKEFTRIKYAIYGGVFLYVMQTIGVSEALKRML